MTWNTIRHFWSKPSSLSHTNRNNTLNCGGQTIKFAVQKVQLSHTSKLSKLRGSNPILRGQKNEVWVKISNLQNCGGTNPILRRQKMRHGSRFQICVGPKVQNCPVWGPKIVQFASGQNLQFANNQIRRVKKRQKMRSPGIEPGSITWQATIITTRPRAQLRT